MVNFAFVPLSDPRLTPELKARFLKVDQLVKWESTDSSGAYSGLVIVGEKTRPQGFQSTAEFTVDIRDKGIPIAKVQEISQIVQNEFVRRAVVNIMK